MADVSKIKFPSGNTYDIKDAVARAGLANIPTKTSDLTNDSGFITTSDIPEGAAASTTIPLEDGTAALGNELAFARGDHRHPHDTSKADKATTLAGYGITDAYTKGQTDDAIAAALTGEFVVNTSLPTASASTMGKIYLIPSTDGSGTNVKDEYITWNDNGTYKWEKIGTTDVDLSGLGDLAYTDLEDLSIEYSSFEEALGSNTSFSNSSSSVSFSGGSTDTFVKSYPGATSKLVTTSVPNVTSAGSASTWNFAMGSGADAETLIISGANGSAPTLGTAITAATGSLASNGGGASVMTGLGTASTGSAVTNIGTGTAAAQTITVGSGDVVNVPVAAWINKN